MLYTTFCNLRVAFLVCLLYNTFMSYLEEKKFFIQPNMILNSLEFATQLVNNNCTKSHKHTHYEIVYVLSGTLTHYFNDVRQILSTGDCVLLTPNDIHSYSSDNVSINRDVMVSTSFFDKIVSLILHSEKTTDSVAFANRTRTLKNQTPVRFDSTELSELEDLMHNFSETEDFIGKRCLCSIFLIKILSKFLEKPKLTTQNSSITERILECLSRSPAIKGGIPWICKHLKYSSSYLCQSFKKQTGIQLSVYIKDLRLTYTAYYLKHTQYTLNEISDLIGIESLSYINKIFKEKYGTTPAKYRKELINKETNR